MKEIQLTKNKIAFVDDEDYEWLRQWKWCVLAGRRTFYAVRAENKGIILMHRAIMKTPKELFVDHIDGNGLNNQKENLRMCTDSENKRNSGLNARSTSGYKGVSYEKSRNLYRSMICVNNERKFIGRFESAKEAAEAYDSAARKYFGKFARTNFEKGEQ